MILLPAETISRHANLNPLMMHLSCKNNCVRLISTDRKYMAVELVGHESGEWEASFLVPQPKSISEALFQPIELNALPMMNAIFHGTANLWTVSPPEYANWHVIVERASKVSEPYGFLFFDTKGLERLRLASPSGHIVFPKLIDTRQPIVLNDEENEDWCGFFMGVNEQYSNNIKPAIIPGFAV